MESRIYQLYKQKHKIYKIYLLAMETFCDVEG